MSSSDIENETRKLCRAFELAAGGSVEVILEQFTPGATFYIWGMLRPPSVGHEEMRQGLQSLAGAVQGFKVDIKNISITGNTVFVERVEDFIYLGHNMSLPVVGVGQVNEQGKFVLWKDYFDPTSMYALAPTK